MLGIRLATMVLAVAGTAAATGWMQTDWSRGGGDAGPSGDWRDGFASSSGLSWLAIPGQLALSSTALAEPVEHLLFDHHPRVYGLCPVDMDDDGRTDIVATTDSGGIVAIWFNRGGDPVICTVLDLGDGGGRNVPLHWRATVPLGATLEVQLRTAPVDDDLGPWATRLTEPSSVFVDRYVQYRVVLGTSDSRVSPLLYQLELAMPRELAHDSDRVEAPVTE